MKCGLIGQGVVGSEIADLFQIDNDRIRDPRLGKTGLGLKACDVVFICTPTPNLESGELDMQYVRDALQYIGDSQVPVIKSTVNPGFSDECGHSRVVVNPEFLGVTPNHPLKNDFSYLVIGGELRDVRLVIDLYFTVLNANTPIHQLTRYEAEVVKMTCNRAVMFKVMQMQELFDVCTANGVDYYRIRDVVYGQDPRFNLWLSAIYPEERGCNSPCIPKDVLAWRQWAGQHGELTAAMLEFNENKYLEA